MSLQPIPTEAEAVSEKAGKTSTHWYRFWSDLFGRITALSKFERSFLIEAPTASDYRVIVNAGTGFKITSVTTVCASGTATLTVKINTTALGGTANSVSSTEQTQPHTSANTAAVGDDIVFTFSSVSTPVKVSVTLQGTMIF